jgi:phage terminase large subunit-like protein
MKPYPPSIRTTSIHALLDTLHGDPLLLEYWLALIPDEHAKFLDHDWEFWARDEQLPPPGDWAAWLYLAGRGAGKTRSGAEWVLRKVRENPPEKNGGKPYIVHLVAPTEADYRDVMIRGESGLLSVAAPWERPRFNAGARRLDFPNGNYALCFSAEQPERLRGPQCHAAWCDEIAAWRHADLTWDMMSLGLRLGVHPQVVATTTPKPIPLVKRLLEDKYTVVTRGTTYDNRANLARSFFDKIIARYEGTRLGRQELRAELLSDNPDALWNRERIDALRVPIDRVPQLERIVVAVDPPTTSGESADECGIVVAGLSSDRHAYVLDDRSSQGDSPFEWAKKVLKAYYMFNADALIVEVNQGGDMVRDVIENANRSTYRLPVLNIREVRAFQGKTLRAEPVAALYEQGRVHHVGTFGTLEDQMCEYTIDFDRGRMSRSAREAGAANYSPDRMDALVYAITDLMLREPVPVSVGRMTMY